MTPPTRLMAVALPVKVPVQLAGLAVAAMPEMALG